MPRTCTVCPHPHRDEIDRRLLDGAPLRNIAKRFSLSAASLFRHNKHISKTLSNARQEAEILRADGLMEHLNHLTAEAARLHALERDIGQEGRQANEAIRCYGYTLVSRKYQVKSAWRIATEVPMAIRQNLLTRTLIP